MLFSSTSRNRIAKDISGPVGRGLFDVVNAHDGWNTEMGYGADQVGTPPFVVITHHPLSDVRLVSELGLSVSFVQGLSAGPDLTVDLPADTYTAQWHDIATRGDQAGQTVVTDGGGRTAIRTPFGADHPAVLWLRAQPDVEARSEMRS